MAGLKPNDFNWIIEGKLAVSECIGGSGLTPRKIRREEEIQWLKGQGINSIFSLLDSDFNLKNYQEVGFRTYHYPLNDDIPEESLNVIFDAIKEVVTHCDNMGFKHHCMNNLKHNYVDCFGGIDGSHESFSDFQKAVSFSMTSFLTTGGIRGGKFRKKLFQPRSFNMGISKEAFLKSNGFGNIHPGEDPDLSIRLNQLGFKTALYSNVMVFHKRRVSY